MLKYTYNKKQNHINIFSFESKYYFKKKRLWNGMKKTEK